MRRLILVSLTALITLGLGSLSLASAATVQELTGDDGPKQDVGWIDYIDVERGLLVMDDRQYRLTEETLYLNEANEEVEKTLFKAEMVVRYVDDDGTILGIWQMYDPEGEYSRKDPGKGSGKDKKVVEPEVSNPDELGGGIKNEGGVWTN